ncbi:MAG: ASKHA domain-containing protein [Fimbriimonadaceae bacterium]|nr:ASKHA domain-containing protein [Fimbriimonadaceae bacterium]
MRIEVQLPDGTRELVLTQDQARRSLAQILRGHDLALNTRCGEKDMCAGCLVELVRGTLEHADGTSLTVSRGDSVEVRGCRYRPTGEFAAIRIPQRSRLAYAPQVLDSYRINVPYAHDPLAADGLGIAVDVGTTTVALQAVDLATGEIVGKASGFNRQMHFGDDVLTRINLCATDPAMLGRMQASLVEQTLRPLVRQAVGDPERVVGYTVAGNTTMLHLLVGEDPSPMGVAPFAPRFLSREPFQAERIGLEPAGAFVRLLPSIGAYIGADIAAGAFASGLLYDDGPSLLVDVGTNGEILLRDVGRTSACATAAGPAFEGSGLSGGIRAGEGAISRIAMGTAPFCVRWEKIGPRALKPTGICGSGYVDMLAEGRRCGLLGATGRFQALDGLDEHVVDTPHGQAVRVAWGQGKRPILVSEADVARLLQAKAAIAAGILTLLRRHGLTPSDVRTLYLAGGFGMHLDLRNAIACGLLPGFTIPQIELVGNTSLAGATLALLDRNTLAELERVRDGVEVVELNLDPGFEDAYLDQLQLPNRPAP